jgi:serine protease Do
MHRYRAAAVLSGAALVLAACGGTDSAHAQGDPRAQVRQQLGPIATIDTATAFHLSNTFRAAAERALPAVVYINVTAEPRAVAQNGAPRRQQVPVPEDLLRQFGFSAPPDMDPVPRSGAGSGFIIDANGHIMTNHHVVTGASRILVRLVDGREYTARLVGSDAATDVAILKIEPRSGETLPVASFGNSDEARIGDWVIALGNPLGLDFTVTAGIVSAKGRSLRGGAANGNTAPPLEAYIQTDAAINPGNSGGPLVDLLGRVIGMNTAISSQSFIGHGFAVPIDLARRVADDLLAHGYVRRPRIGVTVGDVEAVDAEIYGLSSIRGAQITSVTPGDPGARAGLRPGDVVLAVDGRDIRNATDLTTTLARRQPGDEVTFTIWRDRRQSTVRVQLGEFARSTPQTAATDRNARPEDRLGFSVSPVTADEAARLGLPREAGLVIDEVNQFGPAARRLGSRTPNGAQLLRSINGRAVRTMQDFERAVADVGPGSAVSLRVVDRDLGEVVVNFRVR